MRVYVIERWLGNWWVVEGHIFYTKAKAEAYCDKDQNCKWIPSNLENWENRHNLEEVN